MTKTSHNHREPPCPCHDPLVFGHTQPCSHWETQHNNEPPPPPSRIVAAQITAENLHGHLATCTDYTRQLEEAAQRLADTIRWIDSTYRPPRHG